MPGDDGNYYPLGMTSAGFGPSSKPNMTDQTWVEAFLKQQQLREAVASVSLSHPENCNCTTCKAADGDEHALALIADMLEQ